MPEHTREVTAGRAEFNEGWNWLVNAKKWHYFRDHFSLCRRWMIVGLNLDAKGDQWSPDNCAECWRRRQAELKRREVADVS